MGAVGNRTYLVPKRYGRDWKPHLPGTNVSLETARTPRGYGIRGMPTTLRGAPSSSYALYLAEKRDHFPQNLYVSDDDWRQIGVLGL